MMSNCRKSLVVFVLALVVASTALPAAAQGFKWWKNARFQADMALTPDQVSHIDKVFEDARPSLRAHKRALDKLEDELSTMVAEARVGEAELAAFVERVEDARADLSKTRTLMLYRIRRILSAEQHVKLKALFEAREKQRHNQRPPGA